jgi:glycolate oxidase FAD binding subunit
VIDKLVALVGAPNVRTGVECSPYLVDGRTPLAAVFPGTREEIAGVLRAAAESGTAVIPWGGGTHMHVGTTPERPSLVLGLRRLARLVEHEPGDMTATVEAGMPLAALQSELGQRGQWVTLDPTADPAATVGGVLAANVSGPRRQRYGTARDLLLGLTAVLPDGAVVRGGGKVVKNVAGYDLPKLFVGAFGTLGVIAEATLRLRPRPDADRIVAARFPSVDAAAQAAAAVLGSELEPTALELVDPADLADPPGAPASAAPAGETALLVGVDGVAETVRWQCAELEAALRASGATAVSLRDGEARDATWRLRAAVPRGGISDTAAVMRWGLLPSHLGEVLAQARAAAQRARLDAAFATHAGVGVVSAVLRGRGAEVDGVLRVLADWRELVRGRGGHAAVEWAPLAVKERAAVWDEPGPAHRVAQEIKRRLDPSGIMNPGRLPGGL